MIVVGYNKKDYKPTEDLNEMKNTIVDIFNSCAERDIYCGMEYL